MNGYINLPKDTDAAWYNVVEKTLRREVKEEVNLENRKRRLPNKHHDALRKDPIACPFLDGGLFLWGNNIARR